MNFKDSIVLVTGGTSGIGLSLVEEFAKAEANVIFTGTKKINFKKIINPKLIKKIKYKVLDFTKESSVRKYIDYIDKLKTIDVLINNAGINKINHIYDASTIDWKRINKVNLEGPFLINKAVSKKMKDQKFGKIINISSIFGVVSRQKRVIYSSTKWGLIGMTKAMALDLAPYNVLVNSVSPGFVNTELTKKILGKEKMLEIAKKIPISRLANPNEISKLIFFLCSNLNTYITGQNISISGKIILCLNLINTL